MLGWVLKRRVEAKVHDVENHGVEKIVTLRVKDQLFKATVPATLDLTVDGNVRFGFNPKKLKYFDREAGSAWATSAEWTSHYRVAGLLRRTTLPTLQPFPSGPTGPISEPRR